jgi:hypothetical protein
MIEKVNKIVLHECVNLNQSRFKILKMGIDGMALCVSGTMVNHYYLFLF